MSRERKSKKAVTAAPVTIEELYQRKLEIKHFDLSLKWSDISVAAQHISPEPVLFLRKAIPFI